MDITMLRIGNFVLYNRVPHIIVNIGSDKVGILPYQHSTYIENYTDRSNTKFVKTSLIEPIPIIDVIMNDTRFKQGKINLFLDDKGTKKEYPCLTFVNGFHNDFSISLIEDSKFVGTYRLIVYNNEWYTQYPVMSMVPIVYFHHLQNVLRDCSFGNITFLLTRKDKQ